VERDDPKRLGWLFQMVGAAKYLPLHKAHGVQNDKIAKTLQPNPNY